MTASVPAASRGAALKGSPAATKTSRTSGETAHAAKRNRDKPNGHVGPSVLRLLTAKCGKVESESNGTADTFQRPLRRPAKNEVLDVSEDDAKVSKENGTGKGSGDPADCNDGEDEERRKRKRLTSYPESWMQNTKVSRDLRPAGPRSSCGGPLLPYLARNAFARHVLAEIEDRGYVVLRGVVSPSEAEAELDRMWRFVETVSPVIRRKIPKSWYPVGSADPWPHAARDMMQLHQAGWVFGQLRQLLAERVFERLYGRRELHCSKDGFTFQRPTRKDLKRRLNDHFDQNYQKVGLHCIQGSVALLDQQVDDGCFLCWPGSHKHHVAISTPKRTSGGDAVASSSSAACAAPGPSSSKKDWYMLSEQDRQKLAALGCPPKRIPVGRGDVVLWRSDVAHAGASPVGIRKNFRAVVYICMTPAEMTPESMYPKKRAAYEKLKTGSHWPTKEDWFTPCPFRLKKAFDPKPYFKSPPRLSPREEELYGLRRYKG
eukprot:TRINITY_DN32166_c0_g1_i1.p1 TRINITY_DN32166_c0_g1~~TRINITY_DN32166_c0_g1_i1.p1  ORF type:complete len:488 (+),score=71.41 TRINITY_DN32166_c0_g1_i1:125-1588(+)